MQLQQLEAQSPAPLTAKEAAKAAKLPLLSLLTFSPMGNPLSELTPGQCALFFDYLLRSLHDQRKEQLERTSALTKRVVLPAALSAAALGLREKQAAEKARAEASQKEEEMKKQRQRMELDKKGKEEEKGGPAGDGAAGGWKGGAAGAGALGIKFTSLLHGKSEEARKTDGGEGGFGSSFSSAFGQKAPAVSSSIGQLAPVIGDYARGSVAKEKQVVESFHGRLAAAGYKADDIMASLLLVIEDDAWGGEEGGVGSAKPHGGSMRVILVPQKLRSTARESNSMRLASVREMLRYYFLRHPNDYYSVLAAALGLAADEEDDISFMQERLADQLAAIGSFALAQKILAELKKKKKLDTQDCLLRLGYAYDGRKKRLILGKRTCGKPGEAKGIVGLLLASARKGSG